MCVSSCSTELRAICYTGVLVVLLTRADTSNYCAQPSHSIFPKKVKEGNGTDSCSNCSVCSSASAHNMPSTNGWRNECFLLGMTPFCFSHPNFDELSKQPSNQATINPFIFAASRLLTYHTAIIPPSRQTRVSVIPAGCCRLVLAAGAHTAG